MPDPNHDLMRRLFAEALDLAPAARSRWLDGACSGDAALKQRLLAMLTAADDPNFLSAATAMLPKATPIGNGPGESAEAPGMRIGPYKLLQQIGEGGFGAVWMAEQEQPVARRVALKVIKLGMDTRQVTARFEQERQALALMDHPHIARVLDAGATTSGRPYFVMDLVKGAPIVEYCDQNSLSIAARLALFAQVCGAVQHAHGKGIIHRDIKPSNVLVGMQDGRPMAKVIDFGIAKATSHRLTDKTLFTEHQQVIGTLQYMSPEQAEGSLDIDTRTDVYSLGVLLYELLTGSTPFDRKTVQGAMFGELQRLIREVDPPRPSTRLSESRETLASIAAHRRTEPRRLGSLIRGELDWIVMKALEKDRSRRYETANGLALDIQRHLAGEAVTAAPPSASYRLRKFARRNRGMVASAAAVTAALLIGVVGFAWQAAEARARADELKLVADFQAGMLEQIDPTQAGLDLTADVMARFAAASAKASPPVAANEQAEQQNVFRNLWQRVNATDVARELIDRTILKPAVASIETRFQDQPLVAAQLQQTLAIRYQKVGLYDAAMPLQQRALTTRGSVLGEEHAETEWSKAQMGTLLQLQGKFAAAEVCLREVLESRRKRLGEEHPDTLLALESLGELLRLATKDAEAEPLLRDALVMHRRVLGDDHPQTLIAINDLGLLLSGQDKFGEAEPYYRESLERSRRVLGEDHKDTVVSINNMGWLLQAQGRLAEAEPFFVESLQKRRRLQGLEHPLTLNAINNLGMLFHLQGKLIDAEPLLREALEVRRRVLGDEHPSTLISILNFGMLLRDAGQLAEAETLLDEAVTRNRRVWGPEHANTLHALRAFASVLAVRERHAEVIATLAPAEAAARKESQDAGGERQLASLLALLGKSHARIAQTGADFAVAARHLQDATTILERRDGLQHKRTVACVQALADLLAAWDKVDPGQGHDREAAMWQAKLTAGK